MSLTLRSTLSPNIVNELRGGLTAFYGFSRFGANSSNGPQTFEDMGGYALQFGSGLGLTNWYTQLTPSWRQAPTYSIEDSIIWQRGTHSLSFGGSFLHSSATEYAQQMVPSIQLGMSTTLDPAVGIFTATNFPGTSSASCRTPVTCMPHLRGA